MSAALCTTEMGTDLSASCVQPQLLGLSTVMSVLCTKRMPEDILPQLQFGGSWPARHGDDHWILARAGPSPIILQTQHVTVQSDFMIHLHESSFCHCVNVNLLEATVQSTIC